MGLPLTGHQPHQPVTFNPLAHRSSPAAPLDELGALSLTHSAPVAQVPFPELSRQIPSSAPTQQLLSGLAGLSSSSLHQNMAASVVTTWSTSHYSQIPSSVFPVLETRGETITGAAKESHYQLWSQNTIGESSELVGLRKSHKDAENHRTSSSIFGLSMQTGLGNENGMRPSASSSECCDLTRTSGDALFSGVNFAVSRTLPMTVDGNTATNFELPGVQYTTKPVEQIQPSGFQPREPTMMITTAHNHTMANDERIWGTKMDAVSSVHCYDTLGPQSGERLSPNEFLGSSLVAQTTGAEAEIGSWTTQLKPYKDGESALHDERNSTNGVTKAAGSVFEGNDCYVSGSVGSSSGSGSYPPSSSYAGCATGTTTDDSSSISSVSPDDAKPSPVFFDKSASDAKDEEETAIDTSNTAADVEFEWACRSNAGNDANVCAQYISSEGLPLVGTSATCTTAPLDPVTSGGFEESSKASISPGCAGVEPEDFAIDDDAAPNNATCDEPDADGDTTTLPTPKPAPAPAQLCSAGNPCPGRVFPPPRRSRLAVKFS
jgi:hypothetical protein